MRYSYHVEWIMGGKLWKGSPGTFWSKTTAINAQQEIEYELGYPCWIVRD